MNADFKRAVRQSMKRPGFLLVAGILLAGAVGLNAATSLLNLFFRKEALPLRADLVTLTHASRNLGGWVWVPETQTLDPDTVHALGTDKYIMCRFVNTRALDRGTGKPVAMRDEIESLAKEERPEVRAAKVAEYMSKRWDSVINVAVTYYTGKVDTVPHVPDRCYVADGFQPSNPRVETWSLGQYPDGKDRRVGMRFIDFEDQTARGAQNRCVAYTFHANGEYIEDPNMVRFRLQKLSERYAYFAKIEVMIVLPTRPNALADDPMREKDRQEAARAMQDFLTMALPEVEKLLPDWEAANRAPEASK